MEILLPEQQGAGGPSFFFPAGAFAKIGPTRVFGQANMNANLGRSRVREGLVRSVDQMNAPLHVAARCVTGSQYLGR